MAQTLHLSSNGDEERRPALSSHFEQYCAGLRAGVMTFDGITIEGDSILAPREDRVLPIMEEEQVFMCRQMKPLLAEPPPQGIALDVGTGCGVFAIWAARMGWRVIGVDINPRALEFAARNATKNNVSVCTEPSELSGPGVCLLLRRFDDVFAQQTEFQNAFDRVFLNPPYNPTCPKITPPIHAESGPAGQRCFREQIAAVPNVMKEGAWCIGNQMAVVRGGQILNLSEAQTAFAGRCLMRFAHILNDPYCDTRTFLTRQYESYLRGELPGPNRAEVDAYIHVMSAEYSHFAYIHYEICKCEAESRTIVPLSRCFEPKADWDYRIWLQRQHVDNAPSAVRPV